MLPKYENYFKDIAHYVINRINAGASNEEIHNELVTEFKFEVFVPLPQDQLVEYLECFIEFARIACGVAASVEGD